MSKNMIILTVSIAASTLLLMAVAGGGHSPRFYTILRIAVCTAAVVQGVKSFERKNWIFWGNCFVAILFNPFFEISLDRYAVRVFIDIGVSIFFIVAINNSFKQSNSKDHFAEQFFKFIKSNCQFLLIVCLIVFIILKIDSTKSDLSSITSDVSSIKSNASSIRSNVGSIKYDVESIKHK